MYMRRKLVKIFGIIIALYLSFRYLLGLVFPFVTAGTAAIIYYPVLRHLCSRSKIWNGRGRKYLLIFSLIVFYGILFLMSGLILGGIMGQGQSIILNFPFYQAKLISLLQGCCGQVDDWFRFEEGVSYAYLSRFIETVWGRSLSAVVPKMTGVSVRAAGKLFNIVFELIITIIATFFLIEDYEDIRERLMADSWGIAVCRMTIKCRAAFGNYFKTQGVIMLLDGALCTCAFYLSGQPYYLTLGPLVAVVDALPVFGAGIFLIPYGVVLLLYGEMKKALIIFVAYGGCLLIRQTMEPKLMGDKMGIRPLYMIIAMYVGFRLFGPLGFALGPVGLLLGKEIYKVL